MFKRKRTNNDLQNTTQNTTDRATRTVPINMDSTVLSQHLPWGNEDTIDKIYLK